MASVLSFAEQSLWYLDGLQGGQLRDSVETALRLRGVVRPDALEQAVREIVGRHETLASVYVAAGGEPGREPVRPPDCWVRFTDLSTRGAAEREAEAERLLSEEASRAFQLANGPLLRVRLVRLAGEDHVLFVSAHRIAADEHSIGIFIRELSEFYNAGGAGRPAKLSAPMYSYREYAAAERAHRASLTQSEGLSYWREKLKGAPGAIELPLDRPRPAARSYCGGQERLPIEEVLAIRLEELAREAGLDQFTALLAGWAALLARYSHQAEVVIGVPSAGRHSPQTQDLIGLFENPLAVRIDASGDPSFRVLLRRVREVVAEAEAHQETPFEAVVEALRPERSLSITPLFQVMCVRGEQFEEQLRLSGVSASPFLFEKRSAVFDLTLAIGAGNAAPRLTLEYNADIFERPTMQRLLRNFCVLLEAAARDPGKPISQLEIVTEEERAVLLREWNDTARPYPRDVTIDQLFREQAERTPERAAVVFEGTTLTYRELKERAAALAERLRAAGSEPGVRVGLCVDRSLEMVVGLLAIWQAGGAYVAMDPGYPEERLAFMVEDSEMALLLTSAAVQQRLPMERIAGGRTRVIALEEAEQWGSGAALETGAQGDGRPERWAYLLYTSGSTGRPKGVPISHRSLVNFLEAMRRQPGLSESDVLLAVTTLSFDIAGLEIYLPLTTGARVVIAPRETAMDPRALSRAMDASGCTVMQATPATWQMLLAVGWKGRRGLKILCGGEEMPRELAAALLPRCESLWNLYGPTETTIWSTAGKIENDRDPVTVGKPIDNTRVYVLDERGALCPIGVRGELYIGGDGLSAGYWKRNETTAEKFVESPFEAGGKLYRTGDLARWTNAGELQILGRLDSQVKIRGHRIELGEIEAALREHPGVTHAAVLAAAEPAGDKRLVAYVSPGGAEYRPEHFRRFLEAKLPGYMLPAEFVALPDLPLTPNGKIDRRALPAAGEAIAKAPATADAGGPADETEGRLLNIWCHVLNANTIGPDDNFFEVGGDSLLSVRLFSEIQRGFGVQLPLATLFHAPTARSMAKLLRDSGGERVRSAIVPIEQRGSGTPLYCIGALSGEVILFRRLALELGADQPVYGLQPFSLREKTKRLLRVEEIAEHYMEQMEAEGRSGVFALLGYSFGGLVAMEMARLFHEKGRPAASVILVDTTYLPACKAEEPLGERMRRYRHHLREALQGRQGLRHLHARLRESYGRTVQRNALEAGALTEEMQSTTELQAIAMENYRAQPYAGPVHLFRAERRPEFFSGGPTLGWGGLLANLTLHTVPGDHGTMNTGPNVAILARGVAACLEPKHDPSHIKHF